MSSASTRKRSNRSSGSTSLPALTICPRVKVFIQCSEAISISIEPCAGAVICFLARQLGKRDAKRDPQLRPYALYGVTTTNNMGFDPDDIADFKAEQQRGNLRGARILTVKYRFMSAPFIPGSETKTPEEDRDKVDEIVANGADFVKVWIDSQNGKLVKLSPEFCAAVMEQARKRG